MHNKKRFIVILLCIFLLLFLSAYGLFQLSKSRTLQLFGEFIPRVATDQKVVALTFDDGPTNYTSEVLTIIKRKDIKATFYVIGANLEQLPEIGKQIVQDGHELGNHSYSHKRFLLKSQEFIHTEIDKTNQLIRSTGYTKEITFRPPNGKRLIGLPWYLSKHNIKTIYFDVEPDTYIGERKGSEQTKFLTNYTLEHTKPGSIILLHPSCESCKSDRDAIVPIIDGLRKKGYQFVTISELLRYKKD